MKEVCQSINVEDVNLNTEKAKENFLTKRSFENFAIYSVYFFEPAENEYIEKEPRIASRLLNKIDDFTARLRTIKTVECVEIVRPFHN